MINVEYEEVKFCENKLTKVWEHVRPGENAKKYFIRAVNKHHTANWGSIQKLRPELPAPTLCALQNTSGIGMCHWSERRPISIPEAKRFQSFPDQFKIEGEYQQRWKVIGNSVPPIMMAAISKHVRETLL